MDYAIWSAAPGGFSNLGTGAETRVSTVKQLVLLFPLVGSHRINVWVFGVCSCWHVLVPVHDVEEGRPVRPESC